MNSWVTNYLERIKYHGAVQPTTANLADIHQAHMYSVPFEDLDIHRGVKLSLELDRLKKKVIENNRGGFCYELNYLFGSLLKELGYQATFLAAKVYNSEGVFGSEYDHMALLVESDEKWLADVGFGAGSFIRPLRLKEESVQINQAGHYKILGEKKKEYQLTGSIDGTSFEPQYKFTLKGKHIGDFAEECQWKQEHKDSHFVKNKICTMATPLGRKSILNNSFTIREHGQRTATDIENPEMEKKILAKHFNIHL